MCFFSVRSVQSVVHDMCRNLFLLDALLFVDDTQTKKLTLGFGQINLFAHYELKRVSGASEHFFYNIDLTIVFGSDTLTMIKC